MTENDLIYRSALLELVEVFSCYNPDCENIECEFSFVNKADVENAPAIDPESLRPKGRCKFCEDLDWMHDVVCYVPHDSGNATDIPVNYCPYCGAKMEGGSNEIT